MDINRIKLSMRHSAQADDAAWRTLELGVEADLDADENLPDSVTELHDQLVEQFWGVWQVAAQVQAPERPDPFTHNTRRDTPSRPPDPAAPLPPEAEEAADDHYCFIHATPFTRYENSRGEWYSHAIAAGQWCKETDADG